MPGTGFDPEPTSSQFGVHCHPESQVTPIARGQITRHPQDFVCQELAKTQTWIQHANLAAGEALYVPAGWLVCSAVINGQPAGGLRQACMLPTSPNPLVYLKGHQGDEFKLASVILNVLSKCNVSIAASAGVA